MFKNWIILQRRDGYSKRVEVPKYEPYYYEYVYSGFSDFPKVGQDLNPNEAIVSRKRAFKFLQFIEPFTAIYEELA